MQAQKSGHQRFIKDLLSLLTLALLPTVNKNTARRMMWCSDDRHPHDLIAEGHIDSIVYEAIQSGLDPILAIQMATLNTAQHFGMERAALLYVYDCPVKGEHILLNDSEKNERRRRGNERMIAVALDTVRKFARRAESDPEAMT